MQHDRAKRAMLAQLRLGNRKRLPSPVERSLHFVERHACGDRIHQVRNLALQFLNARLGRAQAALHALLLDSAPVVVSFDHGGEHVGREQLLLQACKHAFLEPTGRDAPAVRAGAACLVVAAAPPIAVDDRVGTAALAAAHQPGEKMLRAALQMRTHAFGFPVRLLHLLPTRIVDDAKLLGGHLDHILVRIGARDAFAGVRVLRHSHTIVGDLPGVGGVVQYAVAATARAGECRRAPHAAARGGDAFGVEALHDRNRTFAREGFGEDTADDRGLFFHDDPMPALDCPVFSQHRLRAIAIGLSAGHQPPRHRAALPAPDFLRQFLDVERVHRPRHPDVQQRDRAFGKGVEDAVVEAQALINVVGVAQSARDAIERFGKHDVAFAAIDRSEQGNQSRPVGNGAADRKIGKDLDDLPTLSRGVFTADAKLILG